MKEIYQCPHCHEINPNVIMHKATAIIQAFEWDCCGKEAKRSDFIMAGLSGVLIASSSSRSVTKGCTNVQH